MFEKLRNFIAGRNGVSVAPDGYRKLFFPGGSVDVPANWVVTDQSGEGRWTAKSPLRKIQIAISVMYFTPGTLEEDCERFAMLAVERTQAEASHGAEAVVTRPDVLVQDGKTLVAQYEGRVGNVRRFASKMIMRRGIVAIADIEALEEDQPWLNDVSEIVFASFASSSS